MRVVAESLESSVDWNENTKTVVINEGAQQNDQPATFALNHTYITQNGATNAVKEINEEIIQILSSFRVVN